MKKIKKHINFKKLNSLKVQVEPLADLLVEGVLTTQNLNGFNSLDIEIGSCCHTSVLAVYCGNGIESVQGHFDTFNSDWLNFHCINRKKDKNGNWRYFDLMDWKLDLDYKNFIAERAFDMNQVNDCFRYYRNSFDTARPSIGNFYYNDNGDLVLMNSKMKPTLWINN